MRWRLLVLIAVASVADARPRPTDFEPADDYAYTACERAKIWAKVASCLRKSGKVSLLYELEGAKLVSVRYDWTRQDATLYLYVERDKVWRRGNLYASTTPTAELLSFKRLDDPRGYRLDVGMLTPTNTSLDGVTTTRVMLARKYTTVCGADALDCRTLMTACDAFVGGKAYWSFRGTLAYEGRNVRVRGDVTNGGSLCTPPKGLVIPPEDIE